MAAKNIETSFENMNGGFCSRDREVDDAYLRRDESQTEVRTERMTDTFGTVGMVLRAKLSLSLPSPFKPCQECRKRPITLG